MTEQEIERQNEVVRLTRSRHFMFMPGTRCTGCQREVLFGVGRPSATRWHPYHVECLVERYDKQQEQARKRKGRRS